MTNRFAIGPVLWAVALVAVTIAGTAVAAVPVTKLDVYPPDVHLNTKLDRQPVIVVATRADGVTLDVTKDAGLTPADLALVRIAGNTLHPVADGQTTLEIAYGGHTKSIPVTVADAAADRPISFKLDVMPVFMRAGCNSGSCHGSARGQDGFRLSLFGYDPDGDHHRLTRELGFRRLNLAMPQESLLMEKAVGKVPHTGGKRFDGDSEYYRTLLRWLEAAAPADAGEVPAVDAIELYPPQVVLEGQGAMQQMIVRAKYADGTDRDVTHLAVFLSNNGNSAPVDPHGRVTADNRGEAFVMARFATHTVGSQVLTLPEGLQYDPPDEPAVNYVDELVNAKLKTLRVLPSGRCTDEEFIRRATIDVTGLLPTAAEHEAFVADASPDKRAMLIDRLLARKEFSEIWAMKWAELLMIRSSNQLSYKSMFLYSNWLTDQISNDVPLDKIVRELLSSSGGTFSTPATNFYQIERDTLKTAENTAQVFTGIRTQCAQCHNHPFDRWTMDDYYGFAAFFSQIGRKQGEDYRESVVFDLRSGEVRHTVDNRVMKPKFLGGEQPDLQGRDRRQVMAEWLTAPENPFFGPNVANRIWAHFFGIGIVEPVDDVRVSNPSSNPELLSALGTKLVEYNYDFKRLVRDICNSNAYQRSTRPNASNASDERNFARGRIRRMRAEVALDCVNQMTDTKEKFRGLPLGARAVQIADGTTSTFFLTTFGRAPRDTVCACDVRTDPTLSQALHLINGATVQDKIRAGGLVKARLDAGKTSEEIVRELYIRCLTRAPTPEETEKLLKLVAEGPDQHQALEDVFWAILNSREFLFNH